MTRVSRVASILVWVSLGYARVSTVRKGKPLAVAVVYALALIVPR